MVRELHPHFGFAICQQIEPVRRVALMEDDVTAGKRRVDHARADGLQFLFLEAGKQLQLVQVGDASFDFPTLQRLAIGIVFLGDMQ